MEQLLQVLTVLKDFSPLGITALAIAALLLMIFKSPFKTLENKVETLGANHLHRLPEIADNMDKTVEVLQRIEVTLASDLTAIKTKLDI